MSWKRVTNELSKTRVINTRTLLRFEPSIQNPNTHPSSPDEQGSRPGAALPGWQEARKVSQRRAGTARHGSPSPFPSPSPPQPADLSPSRCRARPLPPAAPRDCGSSRAGASVPKAGDEATALRIHHLRRHLPALRLPRPLLSPPASPPSRSALPAPASRSPSTCRRLSGASWLPLEPSSGCPASARPAVPHGNFPARFPPSPPLLWGCRHRLTGALRGLRGRTAPLRALGNGRPWGLNGRTFAPGSLGKRGSKRGREGGRAPILGLNCLKMAKLPPPPPPRSCARDRGEAGCFRPAPINDLPRANL